MIGWGLKGAFEVTRSVVASPRHHNNGWRRTMSRIIPENVHSHDKHVFTVETPVEPNDFYEHLNEKLTEAEIPGVSVSYVTHREGMQKRRYLRVERGIWHFDVGAFRFGEGMFFSWWLSKKQFRGAGVISVLLWLALILIFLGSLVSGGFDVGKTIGTFLGWIIGLFVFTILLGTTVDPHVEEQLQEIPFFGGLFSLVASSAPYFQVDTAEIFAAEVKAIFNETVKEVTTGQGVFEMSRSA